MQPVDGSEPSPDSGGQRAEMLGSPVGQPLVGLAFDHPRAKGFGEFAGVHVHGAGHPAKAVRGAGGFTLPTVPLFEFSQPGRIVSGGGEPGDLPLDHDTLAGGQAQVARWAVAFAETAFHARVDQRIGRRQGLEILQVNRRVGIENDPGIEQAPGIEDSLDLLHQPIGIAAPLLFNKRGHVAAGAVLGLERPVIGVHHHVGDVVHKAGVAVQFCGITEIGRKDEMQVAGQGVTENNGLPVTVLVKQSLQVQGGRGQAVYGKGHILDEHGGAQIPHGTHGGQQALADLPQVVTLDGVVRKNRRKDQVSPLQSPFVGPAAIGGAHRHPFFQCVGNGLDMGRQGGKISRLGFHQQGGGGGGDATNHGRHTCLSFHTAQGGPVHQFSGSHWQGLHPVCRPTGPLDLRKHHQGCGFKGWRGHSPVDDVGDKGQGSLGADHQVGDDVEGVDVVHQGVEAVAGGVLDLEFVSDPFGHGRVGLDPPGQFVQPVQHAAVGCCEGLSAVGIAGIQNGAVRQHDTHAVHGLVAVLGGAAAHARGVVGGNAADHGGVDRRRVRADLASVRGQDAIGPGADDARLEPDFPTVFEDLPLLPGFAGHQQHRIADGLAGQAGACGPEGDRDLLFTGLPKNSGYLGLGVRPDHDLGCQPIETGVGAVGQGAQGVRGHSGFGDERLQIVVKQAVCGVEHVCCLLVNSS